eukprot:6191228-Pyramimonas_sp.AAC.1
MTLWRRALRGMPQPQLSIGLAGVYHVAEHFQYEFNRGVAEISTMKAAMGGLEAFDAQSPTVMAQRVAQETIGVQVAFNNPKAKSTVLNAYHEEPLRNIRTRRLRKFHFDVAYPNPPVVRGTSWSIWLQTRFEESVAIPRGHIREWCEQARAIYRLSALGSRPPVVGSEAATKGTEIARVSGYRRRVRGGY